MTVYIGKLNGKSDQYIGIFLNQHCNDEIKLKISNPKGWKIVNKNIISFGKIIKGTMEKIQRNTFAQRSYFGAIYLSLSSEDDSLVNMDCCFGKYSSSKSKVIGLLLNPSDIYKNISNEETKTLSVVSNFMKEIKLKNIIDKYYSYHLIKEFPYLVNFFKNGPIQYSNTCWAWSASVSYILSSLKNTNGIHKVNNIMNEFYKDVNDNNDIKNDNDNDIKNDYEQILNSNGINCYDIYSTVILNFNRVINAKDGKQRELGTRAAGGKEHSALSYLIKENLKPKSWEIGRASIIRSFDPMSFECLLAIHKVGIITIHIPGEFLELNIGRLYIINDKSFEITDYYRKCGMDHDIIALKVFYFYKDTKINNKIYNDATPMEKLCHAVRLYLDYNYYEEHLKVKTNSKEVSKMVLCLNWHKELKYLLIDMDSVIGQYFVSNTLFTSHELGYKKPHDDPIIEIFEKKKDAAGHHDYNESQNSIDDMIQQLHSIKKNVIVKNGNENGNESENKWEDESDNEFDPYDRDDWRRPDPARPFDSEENQES